MKIKNIPSKGFCREQKVTFSLCYGIKIVTFIFLIGFITGCKKLVSVSAPITSTNAANVYQSDATAISAVTGLYASMNYNGYAGSCTLTDLDFMTGLSGDELTLYSGVITAQLIQYYKDGIVPALGSIDFWNTIYPLIFDVNSAIGGVTSSNTLTPAIKQQLLGETKFLRAFYYFYLVNLYGDVPLVLGTDYKTNAVLSRTPEAQIWQQIIADLLDAQNLLSSNYLDATLLNTTSERVRPTKWAASALLSRVYLYTGDWTDAVTQASQLITNSSQYRLTSLANTFLKNNSEAIWQLQSLSTPSFTNTQEATIFILPATGPSTGYPVYLSNNLLNSFEPNDKRRVNWIDSVNILGSTYYYAYKYKAYLPNAAVTEYETVFRLAEQYLIRAEAYAQSGNSQALADLDTVRQRAGLPAYNGATDKASVLAAILHERQVEFFVEWGHRWLDLKRAQTIDAVMGAPGGVCAAKGGTWSSDWAYYPIPLSDLQNDIYLSQNSGYN